jgi:hypothetical protein
MKIYTIKVLTPLNGATEPTRTFDNVEDMNEYLASCREWAWSDCCQGSGNGGIEYELNGRKYSD